MSAPCNHDWRLQRYSGFAIYEPGRQITYAPSLGQWQICVKCHEARFATDEELFTVEWTP